MTRGILEIRPPVWPEACTDCIASDREKAKASESSGHILERDSRVGGTFVPTAM